MTSLSLSRSDVNKIVNSAMTAVETVAARPNEMSVQAVDDSKPEIKAEMKENVAATVAHVTNNEPWYQSRVTLGAILAMIAGIAGGFGYAFPEEMRGQIIEIAIAAGPVIGGLLALYGRWVATKPLGA